MNRKHIIVPNNRLHVYRLFDFYFPVYLLPQFRLSVTIKYDIELCSYEEAEAEQNQLKLLLCNEILDCEFTHVTAQCYLFVKGVSKGICISFL